jgi:8-oxo-dGTP pyrophosphatase MutT (NUDIX family)
MASFRIYTYVVIVLPVGSPNASDIKLVLQREPKSNRAWFPVGAGLTNEGHVDVAVRELLEETGMTLIVDKFTMLSGKVVCVPLPDIKA